MSSYFLLVPAGLATGVLLWYTYKAFKEFRRVMRINALVVPTWLNGENLETKLPKLPKDDMAQLDRIEEHLAIMMTMLGGDEHPERCFCGKPTCPHNEHPPEPV